MFAYGFRAFFLAAAASALVLVTWWAAVVSGVLPLPARWPGSLWHGHEMLHGFVVAAIAGFLLTAVPSWTGRRGFGGAPLIRERNRNTPLLGVLAALWAANALFHYALWRGDATLASTSLLATVNLVLVLVTVIGGRITPSFTSTALRMRGMAATVRATRPMTPLAVGTMVIVTILDLHAGGTRIAGGLALVAAVIQFVRLAQWQGHRTLGDPLVWVLHLGYLWIPIGLLLKGLALIGATAGAVGWLHALTVGCLATMIFGVMTRVSLGHTGRPLVLPRGVALAYGLLAGAALLRAIGPMQSLIAYTWTIVASATLWAAAFGVFLVQYGPILWRPRPDGRAG